MKHRAINAAIIAGLALFSSGCCGVGSCCNSGSDYGGANCNQLCGSQTGANYGGGQASRGAQGGCRSGGSAGGCSAGGCSSGGCNSGGGCGGNPCVDGGCNSEPFGGMCLGGRRGCGWGCGPEVFVDEAGAPCYGPIAGLAALLRNSFMSCGCGEMYVDEWISDPPLCNDPCPVNCECGGGECGSTCGSSCTCDRGNSRSNRNDKGEYVSGRKSYNWSRRTRGGCGTCNQGYHGNQVPVARANKSQKMAQAQKQRHRKSIQNKLVQFAGKSPVKQWGDAASQRMQDVNFQPKLQPINLKPITLKKPPVKHNSTHSAIRKVGWFN